MIELVGVTTERDGHRVLSEVSITVEPAEFLLLVGENGAGKTTVLHHCNGLISPDRGYVAVDGRQIADDPVAVRSAIGMVFQDPRDQLVGPTVRDDVAFGPENLGLPQDEINERVSEALSTVGMESAGDRHIDRLSHGERTRVAIAGALAMRPSYLLLDEPLIGLDHRSRQAILERLVSLHQAGTAIVLATHDLRDVFVQADRIIGLTGGSVSVNDTPARSRSSLSALGVRAPVQEPREDP